MAYLEGAFDDGDPSLVTHALGVVARAKGVTRIARDSGVSPEVLEKALAPETNPKLLMIFSLLQALGVKHAPRTV